MTKNIFIKGEKGVGKSTIINNVLRELKKRGTKIGGFRTFSIFYDEKREKRFVYITDGENIINSMHHTNDKLTSDEVKEIFNYKKDENLVGTCMGTKSSSVFDIEKYETVGVDILTKDFENKEFFVLDEIGFFEAEAENFMSMLDKIVNSDKKVLGVIKMSNTIPFINELYKREDTKIYEITPENRDEIRKICNEFALSS